MTCVCDQCGGVLQKKEATAVAQNQSKIDPGSSAACRTKGPKAHDFSHAFFELTFSQFWTDFSQSLGGVPKSGVGRKVGNRAPAYTGTLLLGVRWLKTPRAEGSGPPPAPPERPPGGARRAPFWFLLTPFFRVCFLVSFSERFLRILGSFLRSKTTPKS